MIEFFAGVVIGILICVWLLVFVSKDIGIGPPW